MNLVVLNYLSSTKKGAKIPPQKTFEKNLEKGIDKREIG